MSRVCCCFAKNTDCRSVPLRSEQLQDAQGEFSRSAFVQQTVGVDNVCERAAVCAAQNGTLILHKFAQNGVTAAVAVPDWRVTFEEREGEA